MRIAATVILFVSGFVVADAMVSDVSVKETVQADFLNVDSPTSATPEVAPADAQEEVADDWIETLRRRRLRRQSRFC